jgi:hypothetical protein
MIHSVESNFFAKVKTKKFFIIVTAYVFASAGKNKLFEKKYFSQNLLFFESHLFFPRLISHGTGDSHISGVKRKMHFRKSKSSVQNESSSTFDKIVIFLTFVFLRQEIVCKLVFQK